MKHLTVLALFTAGTVFAQPAGKLSGTQEQKSAQSAASKKYRIDKAACEAQAKQIQNTKVKHPAKVTPYPVAYKKCMELRAK